MAFYALLLAAAGTCLWALAEPARWTMPRTWAQFEAALPPASPAVKLIVFGIYISLCCTFCPLPTSTVVAAVATREFAVGTGLGDTVLLIGAVGAGASTVANLNDYHLFTLILRLRNVAKVRDTRIYRIAARWFDRSPFFLLVLFNVLPIPVGVLRMLATIARYGRVPFAAANFIGRFVRYAAIAYVTYRWDLGWSAAAALLALGGVMVIGRAIAAIVKRTRPVQGSEAA